jgi:tetratricopeptide (TPR) repeat protein
MDRDVDTHPRGPNDASTTAAAWRELQTLLGIVLMAALAYWMIRAYKRDSAVFTCLILFAVSYLPVSGIVELNATVAEHWLYLPSAFLFLAAALEIVGLLQSKRQQRPIITAAVSVFLVIWLAFLATRTFFRTFDWKNQRTFLERTIASGGDSARMLINLGGLDLSEEKLEDATMHLHAALEKEPNEPFAILNLAAVALKENDLKLARQLLERATKMPAVEAQAQESLTILESKETGLANLRRLRMATRTGPSNWAIEKRYVKLLDETGDQTAAIKELQKCVKIEWYRAESWQLLGQLLSKAGMQDKAALAFSWAESYDVHLPMHNEVQPPAPPIVPSS